MGVFCHSKVLQGGGRIASLRYDTTVISTINSKYSGIQKNDKQITKTTTKFTMGYDRYENRTSSSWSFLCFICLLWKVLEKLRQDTSFGQLTKTPINIRICCTYKIY